MQHTLIPLKDRQRLHREYYMRALTVLFSMLSVSLIIGAAALFPGYLRSWLAYRAADNAIAAARSNESDAGIIDARRNLENDSALIDAVVADIPAQHYSETIRSIIGARTGITINAFSISREGKNAQIGINGTALTRDDLLLFRDRLQTLFAGSKIDIPIDQLAKSSNLPFSIRFTQENI